jgi:O-antigen/teichoic acid export membrane protein
VLQLRRQSLVVAMSQGVAGNIVTLGANLFVGVLTARLLGVEEKGVLAALLAWTAFVAGAQLLGQREAVSVFIAGSVGSLRRHIRQASLIVAVSWALVLCVAGPLAYLAFRSSPVQGRIVVSFLLVTVLLVAVELERGALAGLGLFVSATVVRALPAIVTLAVLISFVSLREGLQLESALLAYGAGHACAALYGGLCLRKMVTRSPSREAGEPGGTTAQMLQFGVRVWPGTLATYTNARLDLLLLPAFVPAVALGNYAVAVSVASVLQVAFSSVGTFLLPIAVARGQRESDDMAALIGRAIRVVLLVSGAFAVTLLAVAEWLIPLVYGSQYTSSAKLLQVLLPGAVAWAMTGVATAGLQASSAPGAATLAHVAGAVVTATILPVALIYGAGVLFVAALSSGIYSLVAAIALLSLRRELPGSVTLRFVAWKADCKWIARMS